MKMIERFHASLSAVLLTAGLGILVATPVHAETTASYVHDGLLACWDGIENAGSGRHNAYAATNWTDVVDGRPFTLFNATVNADRVTFMNALTSYGTLSDADTAVTFGYATNGTLEVVYASATGTGSQVMLQSSTASGVALGIYNGSSLVACNVNRPIFTFTSGTTTNAVSVRYFRSKSDSAFVNGESCQASTSQSYWGSPDKTTTIGVRTSKANNPFNGSIYAIRVYDRQLTDEEIAANHAVDVRRFREGQVFSDDILSISAAPSAFGPPTKGDFAFQPGLAANASLPVSCPPAWTNDNGDTTCSCTGWKLFNAAGELVDSGTETAFTYVHPSPAAYRRLEWQWTAPSYRILASANEGGSVSPAEQWVAEGDSATVAALPNAGRGFYRWTNDVPASVAASSSTITFPATAPVSLFASFGGLWHVSSEGDASAPSAGFATGFPTIETALAVALTGDTILLAPGTYVLANATGIAVTSEVRLVGVGGPDVTTVSAMPNGTAESKLLKLVNGHVKGITFANACMTHNGVANAMVHATGASVIDNCVFTDFTLPTASGNKGCAIYIGGTTKMYDSVFRNTHTDNTTAWDSLIPLYLADSANVYDCVVSNNQFRYSTGGAVTIASANAALRRTLVKDNTHIRVESRNLPFAAGVCISAAGTLEDCVIEGNVAKGSSLANTVYAGGLCIAAANAKVRRCVIRNNSAEGTAAAGGVFAYRGGTSPFQDLLIVGNRNETGMAGGLHAAYDGAVFAHCTVYGNTLSANASGTPGAYIASGTLTDSIVYGNGEGALRFSTNNVLKASAGVITDCCVTCEGEASLGSGNVAGNPCFVDADGGDFRISLISPCRDAGVTVADAVPTDLAGVARPQGAAVDMGCYEFAASGSPECAIAADAERIAIGGEAVISAAVLPAEGVTGFRWTISDANGVRTETTDVPAYRYTSSAASPAEITCTALWTGGDEATAAPVSIAVLPSIVHASLAGGHVWPYDTEAKAATNLQTVIDTVYAVPGAPGTVYVHEGLWGADRGQDVSASHLFTLKVPIRLLGLGQVILDGENTRRILLVDHPEAVVSNFAFMRACNSNSGILRGAAVEILCGGFVSDCAITNCTATGKTTEALLHINSGSAERMLVSGNTAPTNNVWASNAGTPVYMLGGALRNSRITDNTFQDYSHGGAVGVNGPALVEDCEISGNESFLSESSYYTAGGMTVRGGGTVRRCIIRNNTRKTANNIYRNVGGLSTYGGNATIEACVITNNVSMGAKTSGGICCAGIYVAANVIVRNCLVADNHQETTQGGLKTGGVYLEGSGALQNCTVYGNTCASTPANGGIYQVSGTITNCIVWGNGGLVSGLFEQHDLNQLGGTAGYSCFGETVAGEGNISAAPRFRMPADGNFFVNHHSPCVHAGIAIAGLVTDIEGMPRSTKYRPTLGCYRFTGFFPTTITLK